MQDLNSLIPVGSGWVLSIANGINDSGEIVGYGLIHGKTHGFLLTPQ
jgi:probable HAF family extracellular repeat protein